MLTKNINFLAYLIVAIGGYLRFYKLNWGHGFFFHPDEYHIAIAVDRLFFSDELNPKLFSYGSFTPYLIYFSKLFFSLKSNSFLIGRFYSSFFSTATILVSYLISKEIFKKPKYYFTATFLVALTPGLIQQAHFATPESILTFWLMTALYLILIYLKKGKNRYLFLFAMSLGIGIGTKMVLAVHLPILFLAPYLLTLRNSKTSLVKIPTVKEIYRLLIRKVIPAAVVTFLSFLTVFPYSLLDLTSFKNSMKYESSVAGGKIIVFYTRQFINSKPLLFQIEKILPYTLGPALMVLGMVGFILLIKAIPFKQKRLEIFDIQIMVIILGFVLFFIPNSFLFAKWTRFLAPTFPFFSLFATYVIFFLDNSSKLRHKISLSKISFLTLVVPTFFWTLMFFSIYKTDDVRITATKWVKENIPMESFILTEQGNTLEIPLYGDYKKQAFDFYHLDENYSLQKYLPSLIVNSDYFIIQSRRIFANHQRFPERFPVTSTFYDSLITGRLGFEKIAEFASYPSLDFGILKLVLPDEVAEETWSVFDHPVVRIYKKTKPLSSNEYEQLLKI